MFPSLLPLLCLLPLLGSPSGAQEAHWTERRSLGFEGPVRSALTTVVKPNPDPRPQERRKLMVQANPDWAVFDIQGSRIEFASASSRDRFLAISKCRFQADGTEVCTDSTGRTQETQKKETTLPDGSREVKYLRDSKVDNREVTHFDEKGNAVGSHNYDKNGKLTSENSTLLDGDSEWKIYDENGRIGLDQQTQSRMTKPGSTAGPTIQNANSFGISR